MQSSDLSRDHARSTGRDSGRETMSLLDVIIFAAIAIPASYLICAAVAAIEAKVVEIMTTLQHRRQRHSRFKAMRDRSPREGPD